MQFIRTSSRNNTAKPRWATSQTGAAADRKAFLAAGDKRVDLESEDIEIESGKQGLLDWLNARGV